MEYWNKKMFCFAYWKMNWKKKWLIKKLKKIILYWKKILIILGKIWTYVYAIQFDIKLKKIEKNYFIYSKKLFFTEKNFESIYRKNSRVELLEIVFC